MDRILQALVSRSFRRGFRGEPMWLAVAAAAFMVRRGIGRRGAVAWREPVLPGERLQISVREPRSRRDEFEV